MYCKRRLKKSLRLMVLKARFLGKKVSRENLPSLVSLMYLERERYLFLSDSKSRGEVDAKSVVIDSSKAWHDSSVRDIREDEEVFKNSLAKRLCCIAASAFCLFMRPRCSPFGTITGLVFIKLVCTLHFAANTLAYQAQM